MSGNGLIRMMSACTCATTGNFSGKSSALLVPHRMEHRVAIRDQRNESPGQALSNMRPSLAGRRMSRIAKGCCQRPAALNTSAQIAKSGGLRFHTNRSRAPDRLRGKAHTGPMSACRRSFLTKRRLLQCATASTLTAYTAGQSFERLARDAPR